jgi:DNA-binding FadR family transcriptional regulator
MTAEPNTRDQVRAKKMADIIADRIRLQIARGELTEGDWLPTEPELMARFGVSRPTLREAFRLLEGDSLVRVRRGPPGGARVHVPGPEAAAPIFGLLLTLSGTTLYDVYEAQAVIEPPAVRRLAEQGSDADHDALELAVEQVAAALRAGDVPFGLATVRFHQRLVELAGNQTLSLVIALLGEVMSRHVAAIYTESLAPAAEHATHNRRALRGYQKLLGLVRSRDGAAAEEFWVEHMRVARGYLTKDAKAARKQVIDLLS